jgi:hypothetical protein
LYDIYVTEIDKKFFIGSEKFNSIKKIIKEELFHEYMRCVENITYIITVDENEYLADVLINGQNILKEWNKYFESDIEEYIIKWI